MGNFLTCAYLLEKYGVRLTIEQLAEVLQVSKSNIVNKLSSGAFDIPHYKDGKVWFDFRDVAEYLDRKREEATEAVR